MSTLGVILTAVGCMAVGAVIYVIARKGRGEVGQAATKLDRTAMFDLMKKHGKIETQKSDGPIKMNDVVAWFRSQNLDENTDLPFIMRADDIIADDGGNSKSIILGVFRESTDEILKALLIKADVWDQQLAEIIGDEQLIVLN